MHKLLLSMGCYYAGNMALKKYEKMSKWDKNRRKRKNELVPTVSTESAMPSLDLHLKKSYRVCISSIEVILISF